jgi:putative phosphoesterase
MILGVISDTHGHTINTLDALRLFDTFDVEAMIHCGDIGSTAIPRLFQTCPCHFVLGNVDSDGAEMEAAIREAGHTAHGRFGQLTLEGVRLAFLHGDDTRLFQREISAGNWDLICSGHTHKANVHRHQQTLLLNPGAVYRANPHSVAVVTLPELEVEFLRF